MATALEKKNLEAHVDLCQQRYEALEGRLSKIEEKVEAIHSDMQEGQKSMTKVLIKNFQKTNIIFDRAWVLKTKKYCCFFQSMRQRNIV